MSRQTPFETPALAKRKRDNIARLSDRYYGKLDLQHEWELYPELDPDYLRDLKRRVIGHHQDLMYRGGL